jgi:hypothetical protein
MLKSFGASSGLLINGLTGATGLDEGSGGGTADPGAKGGGTGAAIGRLILNPLCVGAGAAIAGTAIAGAGAVMTGTGAAGADVTGAAIAGRGGGTLPESC